MTRNDWIEPSRDEIILRRLLWSRHGHTGMYGDDGEMQCAMCFREYGFIDWLRTPAAEIENKIFIAELKKANEKLHKCAHREDYFEPDDGYRIIPPDRGDFEVIMAETEAQLREILGPYFDLWEGK